MKCSKCGAEFDAKFCPECGTPANAQTEQANQPVQPVTSQPQQPVYQTPVVQKKKGGCLKGGLIAIGIIVVVGVIVQLSNRGNQPATAVPASSPTSEAAAESSASQASSAAEQTVFGVNQPVKKDNVEMTVTKVEKSNGGEFDKPKSGMEFVIVTVKYKNAGSSDKLAYNPLDFKMKNSKGQITSETFTTVNQDNALTSGELAPGGEIEGTIAFEQPKDDKALVLQYTGNLFKSDSDIDFKLN